MRFPVRFTTDFQLGVAAHILRTRGRQPMILKLAPFASGAGDRLPPVESTPSMIWIGGAEPLEYLEVPKFVNALAASGREVFLQSDGKFLRRRVHEFQPSQRFRFVFHFAGSDVNATENTDIVEAIRIARLSGFLTVGLVTLAAPDALDDLAALHGQFQELDLDGSLILAGDASAECERAVTAARNRWLDGRWSNLSRLFGAAALPVTAHDAEPAIVPTAPRRHVAQSAATDLDLDEGAQA